MAETSPERQTCPDRQSPGPWQHGEGLDTWRIDRWTTDHEAADRKRLEWLAKNPGSSASENLDKWHWSWGPPRTCSFCGSIHPDDAIRLVQEGWEVDPTGKSYKRYLHPPGMAQKHEAFLRALRDRSTVDPDFSKVPSVWDPIPPVKLYVWHLSEEQITKFNEAISRK